MLSNARVYILFFEFQIADEKHQNGHPERSRSSGGAKDLDLIQPRASA
jgi:hypothetical protein